MAQSMKLHGGILLVFNDIRADERKERVTCKETLLRDEWRTNKKKSQRQNKRSQLKSHTSVFLLVSSVVSWVMAKTKEANRRTTCFSLLDGQPQETKPDPVPPLLFSSTNALSKEPFIFLFFKNLTE